MLREAIVRERHAFAETLRAVGPDAPTLLPTWTAHDVAAHVEAVRRADRAQQPRVTPEELAEVVRWLLRDDGRLLQNVRLVVRTPAGVRTEGTGREVTLEGPVAEVVLWLAGRRDASDVEATGEAALALEVLRI